ncbi:MAG: citramalate synthase [Alphaproteobacteria bacterium]|nr:citramalate synthase [Alphaproteobacteria bacterium]
MTNFIHIFDTTLRDGAQTNGVNFSMQDKIAIARLLDDFKIDFIEAGWPGVNTTDTEFFKNLPKLNHAKIVAFGMTKRFGKKDTTFENLLKTRAPIINVVGKTWDSHVSDVLNIKLEDNLKSIDESIREIKLNGKEACFAAEHFFDGFKNNPDYALECIKTAFNAGARWITLCDTNGGMMPDEIEPIIKQVIKVVPAENLGFHAHNDTGNAVANTLIAVKAGVRQINGTINGLGERCGNADLITVIPDLILKMGYKTSITEDGLKKLTHISHYLYEKLNISAEKRQPYVGTSAFAHKGGLHVFAVNKNPKFYEHINPEKIGNVRHILVSEQAGKSNISNLLKQFGIEIEDSDERVEHLLKLVKEKEKEGFTYDGAEASFELMARKFLYGLPTFFKVDGFRVIDERRYNAKGVLKTLSDATVRITIQDKHMIEAADGCGPVDALTRALFKALLPTYPSLKTFRLFDYKVRIFASERGTGAITRVMIEAGDIKGKRWSTVGISQDIIDASFQALYDSIVYKLIRE